MIKVRAPWQSYQAELKSLEVGNLENDLANAQQTLNDQQGVQLASLETELRTARANLEGQAYDDLLADIKNAEDQIQTSLQNYRFAKSEFDAIWYEYKHAQHQGHDDEAQKIRPRVDALQAEVDELKSKWDESEAQKADLDARLARYSANADSLQNMHSQLMLPIEDLKTKVALVGDRKIAIDQYVLPNFVRGNFEAYLDRVDRCTSCHVNADKGGFEEFPAPFQTHTNRDLFIKTHPTNLFGCTPCHEGQGPALQSLDFAHGFVKHWQHPLLQGGFVEAGCNKCHSTELYVDQAPRLSQAKRMVFDLGCYGCHEIAGYNITRKIGPILTTITSKTTPEFVYRWIRDTKSFREHTRMPNPQFTHEEAVAVAAYLASTAKQSSYRTPSAPPGGSPTRGEQLVESLGCKGCHVVTDKDREVRVTDVSYDIAPELNKIGSKVSRDWLYAWIRDPKQYNPNTVMPNLRLTDSEARDIVAYLMSNTDSNSAASSQDLSNVEWDSEDLIAEGKAVIRNFGCHGCHEITGMEKEGKVSVSLDEFGAKTTEELFFGDALANGEVSEETWEAWTIGKMKHSRAYKTEAVDQRMPNFAFGDEDATTLAMIMKSWDGRVIGSNYVHDLGRMGDAIEKGRRLVRQYNCVGCHVIEGQGGFIRPTIAEALSKQGTSAEEAVSFAPPDLIGEGRKVQPKWLFEFLKNPVTSIRPWLSARMPTFDFNDDEVNALIEYFQALDGMSEPFQEIDIELTRTETRAAEQLYSNDYLSCYSCHQVGNKKPEGPPSGWAPDFLLAPDRLNPDWIYDWIANPQALQPGTRMPGFYPDAAPPDILNGNPDQQIEALTDYLMNIRRFVSTN
jgi:mono/diheme cytochrome c family protein